MNKRISVIYCCPVRSLGSEHEEYAMRFVGSWKQNPPMCDHNLFVVSNGGEPSVEMQHLFSAIPSFSKFHVHDDTAKDIGAYQSIAPTIDGELVVFFGGHSYFTKPKWLQRMSQVYDDMGPNLYGAFASTVYSSHIRTNGFWMPLELFNLYPNRISNDEERYRFEHKPGDYCITNWIETQGKKCFMVTWEGIFSKELWGDVLDGGEIIRRGHGEYLLRDRVTDVLAVQYA